MLIGLHGYGETGEQLQGQLSAAMPRQVPSPHWFTPDGPLPATLAKGGMAWHGLTRRLDTIALQLKRCLPILCEEVRIHQQAAVLPPAVTVAVGFSQGGVLAAGLLAAGVCSAAVAVCAPLIWEDRGHRVPWQDTRLLYIAGGDDGATPNDHLPADHPLFVSGAAELLVLPTMGHELRIDAAARALEFVLGAVKHQALGLLA